MSFHDDTVNLTNENIEEIKHLVDNYYKKRKMVSVYSGLVPIVLFLLWRYIWYGGTIPGSHSDIFNIPMSIFIFIWFILFYIPVFFIGLIIAWRPLKEYLPSLRFYQCITKSGCEKVKDQLNDIIFERKTNTSK
jgi:hypothetical protein